MRTKEQAASILYLRHGATDFPENRYYCDPVEDPPLNATGLQQASLWPERLRKREIAAVYVSPSRRTQETAQPLLKRLDINAETLEGLRERSFGAWDGSTNELIQQQRSQEWAAWKSAPLHYVPPGGE